MSFSILHRWVSMYQTICDIMIIISTSSSLPILWKRVMHPQLAMTLCCLHAGIMYDVLTLAAGLAMGFLLVDHVTAVSSKPKCWEPLSILSKSMVLFFVFNLPQNSMPHYGVIYFHPEMKKEKMQWVLSSSVNNVSQHQRDMYLGLYATGILG